MKNLFYFLAIMLLVSCQKTENENNLHLFLEGQLLNSHSKAEWFVPMNDALKGLSLEQANWKDSSENHSIAQLASHLLFWNKRLLYSYQGQNVEEFEGDNRETFAQLDSLTWSTTLKELDQVMIDWEAEVASAEDKQLADWTTTIANISAHNAYHTGQIIYIRKMKGWWDSSQGVQ
ncbi:DinB family protein [Algoriphagus boseongensis]|uniref:DinB family protein n=1 Tax=Algoriphagus boseongensis TaxID=1442587 RepID=A0A4R6T746_9BACT|nr:DinB family protein [Algoriphagus boseongensis]TDQ18461.1 DinB family protein [Algoriphagus boseongensis]